jgi:DNA-binding transcriptional ArsR family regulator
VLQQFCLQAWFCFLWCKMENEIRISRSEFKALASETRTGIIKLLQQRNYTLTEMSKKLSLAAPTIKQHLAILQNAELIQELDEGRKWKYYSLTRKGKNIFSPETSASIMIVLAVSIFALCGMVYSFLSMAGSQAGLLASVAMPTGETFVGTAKDSTIPASKGAIGGAEAAAEQAIQASLAFSPETQIAMLFGIVTVSIVAGFLIARVWPRIR